MIPASSYPHTHITLTTTAAAAVPPLPNTSPPQSTASPFPSLLLPPPSGTTSAEALYPAACKSPRRHCQPEAHARGPWRGDAEGPRVPPWRARPLGRPYTSRGYRLQVAGGCAGFCMRLDMVPLQRLSRHEHGRGGRGSAPRASFHSTPSTPHSAPRLMCLWIVICMSREHPAAFGASLAAPPTL